MIKGKPPPNPTISKENTLTLREESVTFSSADASDARANKQPFF